MIRSQTMTAFCFLLVLIGSASAQDFQTWKVGGDSQRNAQAAELRSNGAATTLGTARNVYQKLRIASERNPNSISARRLRQASLEWLKAEVAIVQSQSEVMEAVSQFAEREGIRFGKKDLVVALAGRGLMLWKRAESLSDQATQHSQKSATYRSVSWHAVKNSPSEYLARNWAISQHFSALSTYHSDLAHKRRQAIWMPWLALPADPTPPVDSNSISFPGPDKLP